jgi:hypothetical protein
MCYLDDRRPLRLVLSQKGSHVPDGIVAYLNKQTQRLLVNLMRGAL